MNKLASLYNKSISFYNRKYRVLYENALILFFFGGLITFVFGGLFFLFEVPQIVRANQDCETLNPHNSSQVIQSVCYQLPIYHQAVPEAVKTDLLVYIDMCPNGWSLFWNDEFRGHNLTKFANPCWFLRENAEPWCNRTGSGQKQVLPVVFRVPPLVAEQQKYQACLNFKLPNIILGGIFGVGVLFFILSGLYLCLDKFIFSKKYLVVIDNGEENDVPSAADQNPPA